MKARRESFCFPCGGASVQRFIREEPARKDRKAETWECTSCGHKLLSLADVHDADGLIAKTLARWPNLNDDLREELRFELRLVLWHAYLTWNPNHASAKSESGSVRFRAYGTTKLYQGAVNWDRERRGRVDQGRDPKPLSIAASLDAPRLLQTAARDELYGAEDVITTYDRTAARDDEAYLDVRGLGADRVDALTERAGAPVREPASDHRRAGDRDVRPDRGADGRERLVRVRSGARGGMGPSGSEREGEADAA